MDFKERKLYVSWDVIAIRQCDVVFAFMEESNPGGQGLAAEIGYAKALGKTVVFVCTHPSKYWDFVKQLADANFDNLTDGIAFLQSLPDSGCSVYLAGGMRSGWQRQVIGMALNHHYIDPRSKETA